MASSSDPGGIIYSGSMYKDHALILFPEIVANRLSETSGPIYSGSLINLHGGDNKINKLGKYNYSNTKKELVNTLNTTNIC